MQCCLTFVDESLRDDEMMSKTRRKVDVHNAAAVIISAPAERQTTTEIQTR